MSEVPGHGPADASWAIIGEAPGYHEDKLGKPFVGKSGQLLREQLAHVGLDPDRAYITNVVKVRPPNNKTPTIKEINAARPDLIHELAQLPNLRAVLLLGNTPLKAITGKVGVSQARGNVVHEADGTQYFSTLHPAAVVRNANYQNGWRTDLASFARLVNPPEENITVTVVDSMEAYSSWNFAHVAADTGALDIETTIPGDRFGDIQFVSCAVSYDGDRAFVFGPGQWWERAVEELADFPWVMHNGSFDRLWLEVLTGHRFGLAHDTMAMAYLIDPNERKGLEYLTAVYLGLPPYKGVDYEHILDEPFEKIAQMNGVDTARTLRLFRPLADKLNEDPGLRRVYSWILMPAINTLIDTTITGVPIDEGNLAALQAKVTEDVDRLRESLQAVAPLEEFNPNSTQQVAKVLHDEWGLPILERTNTGAPSTGRKVLEVLAPQVQHQGHKQFIRDVVEYKLLAKRKQAFLNKWPNFIVEGRVHPKYKATKVVTGRLASEEPNIQQVPREKEYRNVFGGRDKMVWVKADYSQVELRIAAHVARVPEMIAAYNEGEDLHRLTGERILGSASDEARQVGKALNFSLLYGAGARKLQELAFDQYGVELTLEEATSHRDTFFNLYPRLSAWHDEMRTYILSEAETRSPLGRVRPLPQANSFEESERAAAVREGINMPIQSFASDLLLVAMTRINEAFPGYLVAEIHDEMDLFVPEEELSQVVDTVQEIMEDTSWVKKFGVQLTVPLVADVEVGTHWGSVS